MNLLILIVYVCVIILNYASIREQVLSNSIFYDINHEVLEVITFLITLCWPMIQIAQAIHLLITGKEQ